MKTICAVMLLASLMGCNRAPYYRMDHGPCDHGECEKHSIWFERHKTNVRGICANVIGEDDKWELDLPHGYDRATETMLLHSFDEAARIAEQHCPTHP